MNNRIYFVKLHENFIIKCFQVLLVLVNLVRFSPSIISMLICNKCKIVLSDVATFSNLILSLVFLKHYRNLFYYRLGRVSRIFAWVAPGESSLIIPFKTIIGENAHFVHNIGCHLNAKSIGDNFVCYQHVVIGAKSLLDNNLPVIGNNVTLATGVVVIGNIIIGDNVKVGANSVIINNIPSNCTVAGNPTKIIKSNQVVADIPLQ